jgi:hypothetical protein
MEKNLEVDILVLAPRFYEAKKRIKEVLVKQIIQKSHERIATAERILL